MITDPLFYAAALPAVALYGLSKGGFAGVGILSTPLLALVIPPVQAAAIMLPVLMVQDVVTVSSYRKTWDARTLVHLAPGALAGILAGWALASLVTDAAVRIICGVIAIGFCLDVWLRPRAENAAPRPQDWRSGSLLGALSGYTSFVIHVGGPPFNMYALSRGLSRDVFVGTSAMFFAAVNVVKVVPFFTLGQFSAENLTTAAALFPVAILSNFAGIWLVRRVPAALFFKLIVALTFLVGVVLLWSGVRGL